MDILAWVLTIALAGTYLSAGGLKLALPREKLIANPRMGWANDYTGSQVKGIATAEVLGGLGVILPWATHILPVLTPIAAVGLAVLQVGAIRTHLQRGERQVLPVNGVLLVIAVVLAIVRFTQL